MDVIFCTYVLVCVYLCAYISVSVYVCVDMYICLCISVKKKEKKSENLRLYMPKFAYLQACV